MSKRDEKWVDVTEYFGLCKCGILRPTKIVNEDTPITMSELRKKWTDRHIIELARSKQRDSSGRLYWNKAEFYPSRDGFAPSDREKWVNKRVNSPIPRPLKKPNQKWFEDKTLHKPVKSHLNHKKGMVYVEKEGRKVLIHFGDANMEDYTIHKDKKRRRSYLSRASGIRDGQGRLTRDNKNSANYYSIHYLW